VFCVLNVKFSSSKTDQKDVQIIDNSTAGPTYQSAEDGDVIETETN
jgi:hypothetical protein